MTIGEMAAFLTALGYKDFRVMADVKGVPREIKGVKDFSAAKKAIVFDLEGDSVGKGKWE